MNNDSERIESLREELRQLENRGGIVKARSRQNSWHERKARTRRLIEIGALTEKYLECRGITPAAYESFIRDLVRETSAKLIAGKYIRSGNEPSGEAP